MTIYSYNNPLMCVKEVTHSSLQSGYYLRNLSNLINRIQQGQKQDLEHRQRKKIWEFQGVSWKWAIQF